jgi:hypothetical protein
VQSYGGLIACRLLLGAVEGGLFPGMAVYLTFFYTKRELALRIGYLFVSAALAGACGGLLAYAIGHMDGIAGQRGWRWIMILEGIPTFVLGIATWWVLPDSPETAYFLDADEKAYAAARLKRQTGYTKSAAEFHWEDVRKCFKDWKVWLFCFAQFGSDTMLYGFSTFLPTIIRAIMPKASSATVQVLTIPCYALGAITYLVVAHFSDKQQKRAFYSIILGVVSIIGYAMLISPSSSATHYAGCFLVAMGLYVCVGIPLAWLPTNLPRYGKRTSATGLQLSIGNCAGIMSSFVSGLSFPLDIIVLTFAVVSCEGRSSLHQGSRSHDGYGCVRNCLLRHLVGVPWYAELKTRQGRRGSSDGGQERGRNCRDGRRESTVQVHNLSVVDEDTCRRSNNEVE